MLIARVVLALTISIAALLVSLLLDTLLAPLPPIAQFLVQVPALVLLMDEFRQYLLRNLPAGVTAESVDAAFFFAPPLAAITATNLLSDMRLTLRL
jgi:hypothetical protein